MNQQNIDTSPYDFSKPYRPPVDHTEASKALAEIRLTWKPHDPEVDPLPPSQLLKDVIAYPAAYQNRGHRLADKDGVIDKEHVRELAELLKDPEVDLDPIEVMPNGVGKFIVIGGHHRRAAYRIAKRKIIPVVYFLGTPEEAVEQASVDNLKRRLQMDEKYSSQRTYEILAEDLTNPEGPQRKAPAISKITGRAPKTIRNMKSAMKKRLDRDGTLPATYREFCGHAMSDEDREAEEDKKIAEIQKALQKSGIRIRGKRDAERFVLATMGTWPDARKAIATSAAAEGGIVDDLVDLDATLAEMAEEHAVEVGELTDKLKQSADLREALTEAQNGLEEIRWMAAGLEANRYISDLAATVGAGY